MASRRKGDAGNEILSQELIAKNFMKDDENSDNDNEEEMVVSGPQLSIVRDHVDNIIKYMGRSSDPKEIAYYQHFRQF